MRRTKLNGILASVITASMILTGCNATSTPEIGSGATDEKAAVETKDGESLEDSQGGTAAKETSETEAEKAVESGSSETEKAGESRETDSKTTEKSASDSEKNGSEKNDANSFSEADNEKLSEWLENELTRLKEGGPLEKAFEPGDLKTKDVPIYFNSAESKENISLAFFDPDESVPYISLEDVPMVLENAYLIQAKDKDYKLTFTSDGRTATLTRESGTWMKLDFDENTITFLDHDDFLKASNMDSLMDVVSERALASESSRDLFEHTGDSYERYGDVLILNLDDYGIDLVRDKDKYYMPLAIINDFILTRFYIPLVYNGKSVILFTYGGLQNKILFENGGSQNEEGSLTDIGELYYAGDTGEISPSMAVFNYNELCMMLDYNYGLKETHGISSFDRIFLQTGTKLQLLNPDPKVIDSALAEFINKNLDDGHSGFILPSYESGVDAEIENSYGSSIAIMVDEVQRFGIARAEAYPDGCPGYEEVGNTAYITFDGFKPIPEDADYYKNPPKEADPNDTVGLMLYSYAQITRDGSPVENVVLDLSNNGGGDSNAASFVLGTFLGTGMYSIHNTMTGAMMTDYVHVDLNLDHKFDEKDSLQGYKLYCLESFNSFSCGNLVPSVFKNSHKVTLLGQTSGGGSCMVLPCMSATGTVFQVSGPLRMAFTKNGSFYDIDQGAEPDFYIDDEKNFYDRKALTEYINGLF